jgi:RNA-splicing ligase RtcB
LDTIGAGNHFAEIEVVKESSLSDGDKLSPRQDEVILLVHSGSRGYGGSIFKKYTADSQTSFEESSPEAIACMQVHDKACEWAKTNRDLIALRFLSCLEPGNESWELGGPDADVFDVDVVAISHARKTLQDRKVVDVWHNVERVKWSPAPPSCIDDGSTVLEGKETASNSILLDASA